MSSERELLKRQLEALYQCDFHSRLVAYRGSGDTAVPRFVLGRSRDGNLWRLQQELPPELAATLQELARSEPVTADFADPPQCREAARAVLARHKPVEAEYRGPAFVFPELIPDPDDAREITLADRDAFGEHFGWLAAELEVCGPAFGVLERGTCVSLCFGATDPGPCIEAGVETAPGFRGRGYAPRAVAAWARAQRKAGRTPLYSTSWDNTGSRAVARRLGLRPYAENFWLR
ncbi:MAG: GNAT family N-acetyltransferase [Myxococcota bacterium]|nr:GNAT family N-acetyltransferase [Myxococcota bacterium]